MISKRSDFMSIDPMAVLRIAKERDIVALCRPYFELLIEENIIDINNTLVDLYI